MMATVSTEPTFLYPKSRQFPFDEVCEQIVRALEERNWDVPGITVEFDVYGSGAQKYRMVRHITGDDFKLWFCRSQGRLGNWNDTAAVTQINIPQKEIHVYDDESGPRLYVYCGKNWDAHREQFMNGSKVNSRLYDKPRIYLQYTGGCDCSRTGGARFKATELLGGILTRDAEKIAALKHTHSSSRSPLLVHDSDLGREWMPTKRRDAQFFRTDDVLMEFTLWLQENLLSRVLEQPMPRHKVDIFRETALPYPTDAGPIFCFGEYNDASRVQKGKETPNDLEPGDRYGMQGGGYRLVAFGDSDGDIPDIAHDGFLWCGFGEVSQDTVIHELEVPGHHRWWDRERYLFRVTPNRADGIYVADHAAYEKRRKELSDAIEHEDTPREDFTRDEIRDFMSSRGRTIIPIVEYGGDYARPIVLINRELDFDEVELVSGPWPEFEYLNLVMNYSSAACELFEKALEAQQAYYDSFDEEASEARSAAVQHLVDHFDDNEVLSAAAESYSRQVYRRVEPGVQFMDRVLSAAYESRRLGLI